MNPPQSFKKNARQKNKKGLLLNERNKEKEEDIKEGRRRCSI